MKILYIFPHPDDESFGPAIAMDQQLKEGHEVHLLTLTKGGATKKRHELKLSIEEMGEVRYQEMLDVEKTLGLTSMTVWDYPDSGLKHLDPRILEKEIEQHIDKIRPEIIVSYPVHGISGFHDHLVMHAVIKRLFLDMKEGGADYLKRLAFITKIDNGKPAFQPYGIRIKQSDEKDIDCLMPVEKENKQAMLDALACYKTYQDTIEKSGVTKAFGKTLAFEIFKEDFEPPLTKLTEKLS